MWFLIKKKKILSFKIIYELFIRIFFIISNAIVSIRVNTFGNFGIFCAFNTFKHLIMSNNVP